MAKQTIAAFPATPPRYSLLFAADQIQGGGPGSRGDGWAGGVRWAPEATLGGGIIDLKCGGNTGTMTAATTNPAWQEADPFLVWADDHCSAMDVQRDFRARALRQLEATLSYRVAYELWTGTLAQSASLDNHWLAEDPKILTSGGVAPAEALALIDMGLSQMLGGRRGMIHVSTQVLDQLEVNNAITLNGQLWQTAQGTVVVADAGYPGSEPTAGAAGSNQWIYATPMIHYRLGPEYVNPDPEDRVGRAQATNRETNLTIVRAEREVILLWDSETPIGTSGKEGVLAAETTTAAFAAL